MTTDATRLMNRSKSTAPLAHHDHWVPSVSRNSPSRMASRAADVASVSRSPARYAADRIANTDRPKNGLFAPPVTSMSTAAHPMSSACTIHGGGVQRGRPHRDQQAQAVQDVGDDHGAGDFRVTLGIADENRDERRERHSAAREGEDALDAAVAHAFPGARGYRQSQCPQRRRRLSVATVASPEGLSVVIIERFPPGKRAAVPPDFQGSRPDWYVSTTSRKR